MNVAGAVSTTYDYEQDVRPRLREMSRAISLDELRDFLGQFGAAKASELKPEQFADLMAESGKLIERKAEQAAESERIAAEMEAERQAEKERLAAEAAERATVAEAARAEQQRLEDERMRAAVAERAEKERLAKAERDRIAAEKAKAERERKAAERAAKAEQARLEKERLEQEQAEQVRIADEAQQLRAKQTASGIAGLPFGMTKGQAKYRLRQVLVRDTRLSRAELAIGILLADLYDAQDRRRIYRPL
jgi:hypothetical protein